MRVMLHNLIAHPIAGVCWAAGDLCQRFGAVRVASRLWAMGDRVHGAWVPEGER